MGTVLAIMAGYFILNSQARRAMWEVTDKLKKKIDKKIEENEKKK